MTAAVISAKWTAKEDATLVRLVGEGNSASLIAMEIGRSRASICGRALRLGLKLRGQKRVPCDRRVRFDAVEDEVVLAMAAAGKSGLEIAEALKRSKSSVVKRARRLGAKLIGRNGPKPGTKPKAPVVKVKAVKLHPGNIAGKKESRQHDPVFSHRTPIVAVEPLMVSLLDLRANQCAFPIGDPLEPSFGLCGHPKEQGSYCRAHARIAYQAPEMRRKAA
ncbi:GcrA family cell cycle regulator [Mesorhizobium sp. B2-1-2]|uniref:GcrA family cell cycle regulator n=1 Tax=Mesorhizobium sp. B2-1-2 TaxID=2589973 RepID=UPI00112AB312|nr:GcrA family cell cycle regulator [Mesorhizobium sp. B2-1-2]TPN11688.1 hypothetical protein FJ971_09780 [Mesorhizobium sp. B2-1-2]